MRSLIALLSLPFIGCSHLVTEQPYSKNLAGKCFEITKEIDIYERDILLRDRHHIVLTKENQLAHPSSRGDYVKVASLTAGETIKVVKVQDYSWGTVGNCWRVFATNRKLNDIEFEIPSCYISTWNVWVKPDNPWDRKQSGEELQLETPYLSDSQECT